MDGIGYCRNKDDPKCKGPDDPDTRRKLRFQIERTSEEIDRAAFGLEFAKRATGMFSGLRKVTRWALWSGQRPLERENKDRTLLMGKPPPKQQKNLLELLA
jgi:hypothetical protein